ncbi:hypothetical protein AAGS61_01730 [Lysinibacillus sp. KU-BSD001]|uniref:hypothetical protein n=1 Tax=Lysinibacillus sp. KU-BSD001 TaxID=3141328 RepID=UPI0036E816EC
MAKIYAPNKKYTGVSATVSFVNGIGETDNEHLIKWFASKGYTVEKDEMHPADPPLVNPFEGKTIEELKAYAQERGIDIGKASTEEGIIKKIEEAQKAE